MFNGAKGSMSKVMKSFICRGCLNPVTDTGTGRTSLDIGISANLELVDKSCYLDDMWMEMLMQLWSPGFKLDGKKFWELVPLLTNRDMSLIMRGRVYIVVCELVCCMEVRPGL